MILGARFPPERILKSYTSMGSFVTELALECSAGKITKTISQIANLSSTSMNALHQVVASAGTKGTDVAQLGVAAGTLLGVGMHDWHYVHVDGKLVPVTFQVLFFFYQAICEMF